MTRKDLLDIIEDGCSVHSADYTADLIVALVERWLEKQPHYVDFGDPMLADKWREEMTA